MSILNDTADFHPTVSQKIGQRRGLTSICSAHLWVLQAAAQQALEDGAPLLVESTSNQVNQFGGYTGMTPADFTRFVRQITAQNGLPTGRLILGGDHLGPSPWQHEPAESAMRKAGELVQACIHAGYVKIHLDASMKLADDPSGPLSLEICAQRAAWLAKAAEAAVTEGCAPRYVIGSEVPIPGGAQSHEEGLRVTTVESVRETIEITRKAFFHEGLESAWKRVLAVVVQPGVEYGDDFVVEFNPAAARDLSHFIELQPNLVYEAHSTDYQTPKALRQLVEGHFAILKVGPGLTFAFREAVFSLAIMENEFIPPEERSNLVEVLDEVMRQHPEHWQKHYRGDEAAQRFARKYSLSDRARYYWPDVRVQEAIEKLLVNLSSGPLPLSLLSQYAPDQYIRIREGELLNAPEDILFDHIRRILRYYGQACM